MDPVQIMRRIVDFNKMIFKGTFSTMTIVQSQSEKIITAWLDQNKYFPEHEKKIFYEWMETWKKNREEFKEKIDQGYKDIEGFFNEPKK